MSPSAIPLSDDRHFLKADLVKQLMQYQRMLGGSIDLPEISARRVVSAALPVANNSADIRERLAANDLFTPGSHIGRERAEENPDPYALKPNPFRKGMMKDNQLRDAANAWWSYLQKEVAWFGEALKLIVDDPARARREYANPISDMLSQLCVIPRLQWNGRAIDTKLHFIALSENHVCIFVLMLILDERERLFDSLRICKLSECGRFFLIDEKRPGGPKPQYCSTEHRLLGARSTGAERTARYRQRLARKAK